MRAVAFVALLAVPFIARAESGGEIGVLTVADPPGPGVELVDLTRSLRSALADQVRGVVSPEDLRLRMMGSPSTATLTELDRAYNGAVVAAQSGDYEGSVRTLRAVVEDLERLPNSSEAFAQWSRAMLRLARNEGSLGQKGESREALERLLRADPGVKVNLEQYPPSFARQVEEVRTALKAGPQRKLTVTSSRVARVFVEGREVGGTPLTLVLPAGSYHVSALSGATRLPSVEVDIGQADQTLALDFAVADMYRPDAGPGLALAPPQRAAGIITAGASLKLERMVTTTVASDGDVRYLVGSLYDVRKGSLLREGRMRLAGWRPPDGGVQAMATFLLKGESSSLVSPSTAKPNLDAKPSADAGRSNVLAPARSESPAPHRAGATKKWVALGTGVLTVGLAGYALYENNQAHEKFSKAKGLLDSNGNLIESSKREEYNSLRSDGNRLQNTAKIAGGAAVVSLGVTVVVGYLGFKQSGTFGKFTF